MDCFNALKCWFSNSWPQHLVTETRTFTIIYRPKAETSLSDISIVAIIITIIRLGSTNFQIVGSMIFTFSMLFYADDTQLHLSIKPHETGQLADLQLCLKMPSMTSNYVLGPKLWRKKYISHSPLNILRGISLASMKLVIFDYDLSIDSPIKLVCMSFVFKCTKLLNSKITNKLFLGEKIRVICTSLRWPANAELLRTLASPSSKLEQS